MSIQNVALLRNESGLANQVAQSLFVRAIVRAGGGDDIFFYHDGAHVVRAEAQRHLAKTQSLRQPGRLEVLDVIEEENLVENAKAMGELLRRGLEANAA